MTGSESIDRAVAFIEANYAEPHLTVEKIAQQARYTKFHFTRVFAKVTGQTPHRYLTQVRIERAKELLTTTDLRVGDVATKVGRESIGTFTTVFHAHVGCCPREYRRRHRVLPEGEASGV